MPMITVQYSTPRDDKRLPETIARRINQLSADFLHNDPAITAITVERVNPDNWFVGGASLTQHQLSAVWIDIRVTDGTKTREDKAGFVAAAFAGLGDLLGPLHGESYIHVNEVRGDAYGFGGLTQNERYFANKLARVGKAA